MGVCRHIMTEWEPIACGVVFGGRRRNLFPPCYLGFGGGARARRGGAHRPYADQLRRSRAIGPVDAECMRASSGDAPVLEVVQAIVSALVDEDLGRAQLIARASMGFVKYREARAKQHPEKYPVSCRDYAMAHHEAVEALARVMSTMDLKRIVRQLNQMFRGCVACHSESTLPGRPDKGPMWRGKRGPT